MSIPINPSASRKPDRKQQTQSLSVWSVLTSTDSNNGNATKTLQLIPLFHSPFSTSSLSLSLSLPLCSRRFSVHTLSPSLTHTDSPSVTAPSSSPLPPHTLLMSLRHTCSTAVKHTHNTIYAQMFHTHARQLLQTSTAMTDTTEAFLFDLRKNTVICRLHQDVFMAN